MYDVPVRQGMCMSVIDLWSGVVGDSDVVTVLLGGDVMLGRGVDQILPHPGEPELRVK